MKTFKEYLLEISSSKALDYIQKANLRSPKHNNRAAEIVMNHHKAYNKKSIGCVGNCVNSFSKSTGDTKNKKLPYRDVSHFAHGEENASEISRSEFEKHHPLDDKMKKIADKPTTRFLHDSTNKVHMMHDTEKDVHHFFVKE